jgi:TolB protein
MKMRTGTRFAIRSALLAIAIAALFSTAGTASAQDWFKTGTGLGVSKVRLAVPDFGATAPTAQPLEKTFHDVLWNDLEYSGIVEMVSPSFYPTTFPTQPSELNAAAWSAAPANTYMIAFGNIDAQNGLAVTGNLFDVRSSPPAAALQKNYRGNATDGDARRLAHQFADDIIARLSGGVPGIASTQIAFVSNRSGNKEIWVMDYDGSNQHEITQLKTIALTPRWSPDATRIAFTCYAPYQGNSSAQICMYSTDSNRLISFPRYRGTTCCPAWSPDGKQLAFMASGGQGDPGIYTSDADGGHLHRLSLSRGVSTSPVWNPKTGQQIIFLSDRAGDPVLYQMNADGSNVEKIAMPDMGYVVDPSWSPNGQLLAFAWRRPSGNFDIYIMDIVSRQLVELTRDTGRNERPSWAPDGRHLVFESTRTGTRQIWTMLADGSEPKEITYSGQNESPNWSPK